MERNDLLNRQLGIAINQNSKDLVKNCENLNYIFHFRLFYQLNHNDIDLMQIVNICSLEIKEHNTVEDVFPIQTNID